jgi:peptidoglycan/LPS O-acetylase OafA/YrhL
MNHKKQMGAHETNLDFIRALAVLMVVGSHLALPVILIGNKAAGAISRKRLPVKVQTSAARAGVRE